MTILRGKVIVDHGRLLGSSTDGSGSKEKWPGRPGAASGLADGVLAYIRQLLIAALPRYRSGNNRSSGEDFENSIGV